MNFKLNKYKIANLNSGRWLCIELNANQLEPLEKVLKNKDITVDIAKTKKSRSLTSNSYAWSLIHKLAPKLRTTDDEVYKELLIAYGPKEYAAAPKEAEGILAKSFKVVEAIKECQVNERKMVTYRLVRGSSTYTQQEMTIFIDGLVSECKKQNVETLPPKEVERLIKLMEG